MTLAGPNRVRRVRNRPGHCLPKETEQPMCDEQKAEMLNAEQKAKYLQDDGGHCPYCGTWDITGNDLDFHGGVIVQEVSCNACQRVWFDNYTLTAVYGEDEP